MRQLPAGALAALKSRRISMRDFIWIKARKYSDGLPIEIGYWSDLQTIHASMIDGKTGLAVTRTFKGAGSLISVSDIPMTSTMSVQTVSVSISQIADYDAIIKAYDLKLAEVEIGRGLFTPGALVQIAPIYPRFIGFVDETPGEIPAEGGAGAITLTCVSHSQEMSRMNPATRSDADSKKRNDTDTFMEHAAAVGGWEFKWGA